MRLIVIATIFCALIMPVALSAGNGDLVISPLLCGANAQFHYCGMYYGTLPYTNQASKRNEFMKLLHERGIRAIRFPGGQEVQVYLPENYDAMRQPPLNVRSSPEKDPQKLASVWDFLDFCREAGITPIFQASTYIYSDGKKVYKLAEKRWPDKRSAQLPMGNRDDAAKALKQFLRNARKRGLPIKNVELGNEEYAVISVEDYYDIAVRYINAIHEAEPAAMIWITLGSNLCSESDRKRIYPWAEALVKKLAAAGFARDPKLGFTLHYVWPEYIRLYSKLLKSNGFEPRFAVTEFHMAGNGDYSDLCPRYGYALHLAQFLVNMAVLPSVKIMCVHDLVSQNFGITHYNQKCYGPPDFKKSWDPSLGYQSMPAAYVYQLFSKLVGGTVVSKVGTSSDQLVVQLNGERRIFCINNNVNPKTVNWGTDVTGKNNMAFECSTLIPRPRRQASVAKPGEVSAEALGAANYNGDPLRMDKVEIKQASGSIDHDGLTFTIPSYGIAYFRCYRK